MFPEFADSYSPAPLGPVPFCIDFGLPSFVVLPFLQGHGMFWFTLSLFNRRDCLGDDVAGIAGFSVSTRFAAFDAQIAAETDEHPL